jgi:tetratricopeptide (TPR) repeat protein
MKRKAEGYKLKAYLHVTQGQFEEAKERFRKAVEVYPSFSNSFDAASFFYNLNCFDEAKEYLKRCLDMDSLPSERANALNNLGNILWKSNEYPEAEAAYADA